MQYATAPRTPRLNFVKRVMFLAFAILVLGGTTIAAKKKILFLAGPPSHANGLHEFRAGSILLADALNESGLDVEAKVHWYGWPEDESIFDGVDACIVFADAGGKFGDKYAVLDKHVKKGMGIMFMHYGVHPTKDIGEKYFKHWLGGYMETAYSVNPHWVADLQLNQDHPVSRGLPQTVTAYDEWYYNMRFPKGLDGVGALAVSIPEPKKMVRYINLWNRHGSDLFGTEQSLVWYRDPKKGGRGVGFVGGHYHHNWAIDDFRKLALNAIVWTSGMEVPNTGVNSKKITKAMLNANLDKPVEGKPIELPTDALLTQEPAKLPSAEETAKRQAKAKARLDKEIEAAKEKEAKAAAAKKKGRSVTKAKVDFRTLEPKLVDPANFVVDDGLEVTVWASSPMLYNPTNMDVDQHGRIWVNEGANYRWIKQREEGDRIIVLQDTNLDGQADSSHVFWQDKSLASPLGIAVFDNKVVVSQPPHLLVLTDVDRNLRFDPKVDKKEILLTGFNAKQHDHSLHAVVAGPDGKWYINNGNCGAQFTDKSGKTFYTGGAYYNSGGGQWFVDALSIAGKRSDDGYVWAGGFSARMNPDGSDVEIIGHGYRNSYENINDSFGNLFQNDNDDPPACRNSYVMEYGSAGFFSRDGKRSWRVERRPNQEHGSSHWRQEDPGTFDVGDIYGGGSPTGVTIYENGALGEAYNGTYLSCEAGKNVVFGYQPKAVSATYEMNRRNFMDANPEQNYLGSDFVFARERIEAHLREGVAPDEQKKKAFVGKEDPVLFRPSDVMVGVDGAIYVSDWFDGRVGGHGTTDETCSGTIYRIAPKGFKPSKPEFDLKTVEGQIAALSSPANNVRYLGFEALKAGGVASLPAVLDLLGHSNKWIAARAIWLLPHLGDEGLKECEKLLKSGNWENRLVAYRALRRVVPDMTVYATKMAKDRSEAVRRDVALSLRDIEPAKNEKIVATLAKKFDVDSKNALEAIGLGLTNHEQAAWASLRKTMARGGPLSWSTEFAKLTWRLGSKDAVPDLLERARSEKLSLEERSYAVESLAWVTDNSAAQAMMSLAEEESAVKDIAKNWLIRFSTGEWSHLNIAKEMKDRGIYDPDSIVVTAITVPAPADTAKFSVADVLALKGDAKKGKATVMRCVMCHQVEGQGPDYGPSLKGWAATQSDEVLVSAIVNPSQDIAHGMTGSSVVLKLGGQVHGIVLQQGNPTIVKSTGGVTQTIPADRIKTVRKLDRSLMLSADQLGLSAQDVADIAAYLKKYN